MLGPEGGPELGKGRVRDHLKVGESALGSGRSVTFSDSGVTGGANEAIKVDLTWRELRGKPPTPGRSKNLPRRRVSGPKLSRARKGARLLIEAFSWVGGE